MSDSPDFSTVDDFLRQAFSAKAEKKQAVSAAIAPHLDSHGTVGLPPEICSAIESLIEDYGDEVYRQVALFSLGKWFELHIAASEQFFFEDKPGPGCSAIMDATRISDALHLLCELHSFSGDAAWKEMLDEKLSQFILESMEEGLK